MEVDFPWKWAEINNAGKLRNQDEQRGFVGSGPGNPQISLTEELAEQALLSWPLWQGSFGRQVSWLSLRLEAAPASLGKTRWDLCRALSCLGNYGNTLRATITRYRTPRKRHLNYLLIIRAGDFLYLPTEG